MQRRAGLSSQSQLLLVSSRQVASQVLLHLNRRHAVVRASTYIFCQLIVVGAYFILASIIFYARGRNSPFVSFDLLIFS
jgi:hypothetical protein